MHLVRHIEVRIKNLKMNTGTKTIMQAAAATAILLSAATACKTTEANYRSAYEKVVAGRDSTDSMPLDSTIYGSMRRMHAGNSREITTPGGYTTEVMSQFVKVTEGGGGIPEYLKPYCVVAGQFKQKFNAVSLRDRLVDLGFPSAFVVETPEPFYYIVSGSYAGEQEAAEALDALRKKAPASVLRSPAPFILRAAVPRRKSK